jgi:hypothetical protein
MKRNCERSAWIRRRSWILKTVLVEPPPWRQRMRGRVSAGSGAGVVERDGGPSCGGGASEVGGLSSSSAIMTDL